MTSQPEQVVVLGAGYTGLTAALRLARRARRRGITVTVVNPSDRFVERLRLHQIGTGQQLPAYSIPEFLEGTGVRFVPGRAEAIDPGRREVTVHTDGDVPVALRYDYLIYALGSATDTSAVPGADLHAYTLNGPAAAAAFARRLAEIDGWGSVAVCGNGLTGIEAAAEIAEEHPGLRVVLLGRSEPPVAMGPAARRYLFAALDRLGVQVVSGAEVTKVLPDAVELASGATVPAQACLWTTGFRPPALAAAAGLEVDGLGRIVVDDNLRSVSHPEILAVGDAAAIRQPWGELHGTCQSGMPTAMGAAVTVIRLLDGKRPDRFRFGYVHQHISLGRRDAVVQFVKADETPRRLYLTGRLAVRYKEAVCHSPVVLFRAARRVPVPWRLLALKGGRATRRPPA